MSCTIEKRRIIGLFAGLLLFIALAVAFLPAPAAHAAVNVSNPRVVDGVVTWDCVLFGNYAQSDASGQTTEPIKWRVLQVEDGNALLLADKILDAKPYNQDRSSVTWEDCSLRTWLNDDFLNAAFTQEQNDILTTTVQNPNNPDYGTSGGNATQDKVFLLSIQEANDGAYGFLNNQARRTANTAYAKAQGKDASRDWWLRSPGHFTFNAAKVNIDGSVNIVGGLVEISYNNVRPALWVDLSSSALVDAGTVSSAYTVTFDVQGQGTAPDQQIVDADGKVEKPQDPTAEGYIFCGWYKEATYENEWDFENDVVTADTTLYAKWAATFGTNCAYTYDANKAFVVMKADPTQPASFTSEELRGTIGMFAFHDITSFDVDVAQGDSIVVNGDAPMFSGCQMVKTIDLVGLDLTEVTSMDSMFYYCNALTSIAFPESYGQNATSTKEMFSNCVVLKILDLSGMDTSKVKDMTKMFENCGNLKTLDLSGFDTSNVRTMENMFCYCYDLESLDVSSFNTSQVQNMRYMFCGCFALEELDVASFDTSQVLTMYCMFYDCRKLTSLNLASFDTSKVSELASMFKNCSGLKTIYASKNFKVDQAWWTDWMFDGTTALTGGAGTPYDSNHMDGSAACIDKTGGTTWGTDKGYFTGADPMHRMYNPYSGEHFYTADDAERDGLISVGWTYEGTGWIAPETGDPVYRLYNRFGGEHHYTLNAAERDTLVAAGWEDEGIGWHSDVNKTVPVYREYNPYAFSNNHNYTPNLDEHNFLVSLGWQDEGIAWYGV